jgi:hypothetical protein
MTESSATMARTTANVSKVRPATVATIGTERSVVKVRVDCGRLTKRRRTAEWLLATGRMFPSPQIWNLTPVAMFMARRLLFVNGKGSVNERSWAEFVNGREPIRFLHFKMTSQNCSFMKNIIHSFMRKLRLRPTLSMARRGMGGCDQGFLDL